MKKLLLIIAFVLSLSSLKAQQFEDVVKFLPINLHFNSAVFEWEHQEGRNSLILDVGIPYKASIIGRSFGDFVPTSSQFQDASLHSYSVRAAYRHYITNNDPFGFYVEGYVKSQTQDWNATIINPQGEVAGTINGYFYGVAPGIQLGYQYLINKHILFDFYVIGFEVNNANGNATSRSSNMVDAEYTYNFVNSLANAYLPSNAKGKYESLKYSDNERYPTSDYKLHNFAYPWFRIGISVGYRF